LPGKSDIHVSSPKKASEEGLERAASWLIQLSSTTAAELKLPVKSIKVGNVPVASAAILCAVTVGASARKLRRRECRGEADEDEDEGEGEDKRLCRNGKDEGLFATKSKRSASTMSTRTRLCVLVGLAAANGCGVVVSGRRCRLVKKPY
jgi:hypothetical protein